MNSTEELLKQVAEDAHKSALDMVGEGVVDNDVITAIHEAGYQRGRREGFESGKAVGRSHLSYPGFFAFYMLSMLVVIGVSMGAGIGLDFLTCPVPQ